jgi:hypothetical protein
MKISLSSLFVCQQVIEIHILDYVSRISTHFIAFSFIAFSRIFIYSKNADGVSAAFGRDAFVVTTPKASKMTPDAKGVRRRPL